MGVRQSSEVHEVNAHFFQTTIDRSMGFENVFSVSFLSSSKFLLHADFFPYFGSSGFTFRGFSRWQKLEDRQ